MGQIRCFRDLSLDFVYNSIVHFIKTAADSSNGVFCETTGDASFVESPSTISTIIERFPTNKEEGSF